MFNTCKSNVVFGELDRRKRGSLLKAACLAQEVRSHGSSKSLILEKGSLVGSEHESESLKE